MTAMVLEQLPGHGGPLMKGNRNGKLDINDINGFWVGRKTSAAMGVSETD